MGNYKTLSGNRPLVWAHRGASGYAPENTMEAFEKAADGKATKLIIPSEIASIAGLASSLTEIAANKQEKTN